MYDKQALNRTIGERIKLARIEAGYTQQRLADLVGMSSQNLSAVERGVVGVSFPMLLSLCDALAVTTDSLLRGTIERSDVSRIVTRLETLSPENLDLIERLFNTAFELISINQAQHSQITD